jgi:hypothetical protein
MSNSCQNPFILGLCNVSMKYGASLLWRKKILKDDEALQLHPLAPYPTLPQLPELPQ